MTHSYPPQKFCDKCGQPDLEYPYTSYTGQIPQVSKVGLGSHYHHFGGMNCIPNPDFVGIDLGNLCQKCRQDIYSEMIKVLPKYKDFPKRIDEYSKRFTMPNSDEKVKPYWEKEIKIRTFEGKELKSN